MLPDQTGTGAVPLWRAKAAGRPEAADAGRLADELGRGQRAAARRGPGATGPGRRPGAPISRSSALIAAVSSRIRPTSSRAIRATVPGWPARRASRVGQDDRPVEAARRAAPRPGRARGGASAAGSGPASARRRGPRGGRRAAGPPARGRRAGDRQVLAERRPGDREGVDRIALAGLAAELRRAPAMSLGGTRTTRLAGDEQVASTARG